MSKKTYNSGEPSLGLELEEETATEQKDPVTVLGLTFANDDERREYFRAELRRKLPELRNIEGFPIGEDDDIIALSDPPYYTACPNPWLNDFIAEWEAEKKDLEAKGLRKTDFEVTEPYSADVSEGKNNPIYNAHSYHTKVPHPAIMRYILHYTQPGDIIFDGFCGTGMTGVAATMCRDKNEVEKLGKKNCGVRHAILSDLSPVASLISANYNIKHQISVLDKIDALINEVENKYDYFYKTKHQGNLNGKINYIVWSDIFLCPNCGEEINFYEIAVDEQNGKVLDTFSCPICGSSLNKKILSKSLETSYDSVLNNTVSQQKKVPVLINYSVGRNSYNKKPDEYDILVQREAQQLAGQFSYVIQRMTEGAEARRNDRQGLTHVHHFYFPKTLIILEEFLKYKTIGKELLFLLNSQLVNISKLNRYRPGVSFPYNPLSGTLYIGSQISEANPFVALRNKLKKLRIAFSLIGQNNLTSIASANATGIESESVDYIFTDPPFGANISYSELNFIQESWLKVCTDNTIEAIENDSLGKSKSFYQDLMTSCFKEYFRVLKAGRWLTVEFSNTSAAVWNSIQQAIQCSGFVIANVAALDKQQGSFKAVTTTTAVKQDLIISCFKPSEKLLAHFENMRQSDDNQDIFVSTQSFIEELLTRLPVIIVNEKKTTAVVERSPKILYDRLIAFFVQNGRQIPMDASEFQRFLRDTFVERDGMFFTAEQAIKYDDLRRQNPEMVSLALFVGSEADGVQWLKRELVDKPQTYQDLQPKWMQDLVAPKKGDAIPELMQILEENFLKNEDSQWYIPDAENEADLEKVRTRRLLREFKTYVEAAEKPKGRIKEARLEALRTGFKNCYQEKDFATIVRVGDRIPQSLLTEDDVLLQYYDIATNRI